LLHIQWVCCKNNRRYDTNIKIIEAQQAKFCNSYKNTKLKLPKTNAAVWFNKIFKTKQLTPKYRTLASKSVEIADKTGTPE
jgi:hypothetical protein